MHPNLEESLERAAPDGAVALFALIEGARLDEPIRIDSVSCERSVRSYRVLLEVIGDGVKLTSAGYLPPAVVIRLMSELGWTDEWIGKGNREDHTGPVRDLRASAQDFGLLRRHRGMVVPTVRGRKTMLDPDAMWTDIATRITRARHPVERDAIVAILLIIANRRIRDWHDGMSQVAHLLNLHGWRLGDGSLLDYVAGADAVGEVWRELGFLDVFGGTERSFRDDLRVSDHGIEFARRALRDPALEQSRG